MSNTESFTAWADPALVAVTSRFFDNSIMSITRELLQNARRSGATEVRMTNKDGKWHYRDNGPGCTPQSLMGLGSSSWGDEVKRHETPAGCGFASLSRRNPVVRSPKMRWHMELTESHFNGVIPITPSEIPVEYDTRDIGLEITFDSEGSREGQRIASIARYMPIDFYLNESRVPSHEDFLKAPDGCIGYVTCDFDSNIRVAVYLANEASCQTHFNYNGWVLESNDYDNSVAFETIRGTYKYVAKFDVANESALPLELPQRNSIIKGARLKTLRLFAKHLALQLAAENLADVSTSDPGTWVEAIAEGYDGPVCYPKFAGRLMLRDTEAEIADYRITTDEISRDGIYALGEFVTWDAIANDESLHFAPEKEVLGLIAQAKNYGGEGEDEAYLCTADEFFPGVKLVKPVKGVPFYSRRSSCQEADEWYAKFHNLYHKRRSAFVDSLRLIGSYDKDGEQKEFSLGISEMSHLVRKGVALDSLSIAKVDDEEKVIAQMQAPALFELFGDRSDGYIEFLVTKDWLAGMPKGFISTIVEVTAEARNWEGGCDDLAETMRDATNDLERKMAKITGYKAFVLEKLQAAVSSEVEKMLSELDTAPEGIVIKIPYAASCKLARPVFEIVPKWKSAYSIRGSHGVTQCDEHGNRMPFEDTAAEVDIKERPHLMSYRNCHSFDVASLRQLGNTRTELDILEIGAWIDSTKLIYMTPTTQNALFGADLLGGKDMAECEHADIIAGLERAMNEGRLSSTLYSAWKCDPQFTHEIAQAEARVDPSKLPEFKELWTV